jgi:catechol-2,3-dioxygenase
MGQIGASDRAVARPRLHHVFLKTTRLAEMKAWYGAVLGMEPNFEWESGAFLTNDGANHRLVLYTSPSVSDDDLKLTRAGLHHVAYEYESCDDLFATYGRLKERDIEPHAALDHGMTMSFYYLDPDGNSVELQYDHFGDWSRSTAFMRGAPEFAQDPIGKPVDPEALAAARRAGMSVEELHRRAYAGEMAPTRRYDLRIPT